MIGISMPEATLVTLDLTFSIFAGRYSTRLFAGSQVMDLCSVESVACFSNEHVLWLSS